MRAKRQALVWSVVTLLGWASTLRAGDLNPPPGPVAPSGKTLNEVRPSTPINITNTPGDADSVFKITQPGSYHLTENIFAAMGKHSIEIDSGNVNLNLEGFSITGVGGSLDGIHVTDAAAAQGNIHINGLFADGASMFASGVSSISGVDGFAVFAPTTMGDTPRNSVSGIAAEGTLGGIKVGDRWDVGFCGALGTGGIGIETGNCSNVGFSSATLNSLDGIKVGDSCNVGTCATDRNGGDGVEAGERATVTGGSHTRNTESGVNTGDFAKVKDVRTDRNGFAGVRTGFASNVSDSRGDSNLLGINIESGTITNCQAYDNQVLGLGGGDFVNVDDSAVASDVPGAAGIGVGKNSRVKDNVVFDTDLGVSAGDLTRIEGNDIGGCDLGVQSGWSCTIKDNTLDNNIDGMTVLPVTPMAGSNDINSNSFSSNSGNAVELNGDTNLVRENTFANNGANVLDNGANSKIAPIQCDPLTAGPFDNWEK